MFGDTLNKINWQCPTFLHFYDLINSYLLIAKFGDTGGTQKHLAIMKKLLRIPLLLVAMLLSTIPIFAHDFEVDGICYDITGGISVCVTDHEDETIKYTGNLIIPETVTYSGTTYPVTCIVDGAFRQCSGLTSVTIPNSVTSIGNSAFSCCTGLTSVIIGNSVTNIDHYAFLKCSGLISVTIGTSVSSFGSRVFGNCNNLEFIKVLNPTSPPDCTYDTFAHYDSFLEVPEGSINAYQNADVWCNFTNITAVSEVEDIELNTGVEEIERYDINGHRLAQPTQGINIIKMSDGTTRKEFVK